MNTRVGLATDEEADASKRVNKTLEPFSECKSVVLHKRQSCFTNHHDAGAVCACASAVWEAWAVCGDVCDAGAAHIFPDDEADGAADAGDELCMR